MRRLRAVGLSLSLLLTGGIGVSLILSGAGVLSLTSLWGFFDTLSGEILLILVGAALLLVGVYFLIRLADERVDAMLFHHDGEWGRIEVSPLAIKEFIAGILRDDIGLEQFRVRLSHRAHGVGIAVRTTLPPHQRVTDVGERIQRALSEHVSDRTGVEVRDVTVLVRGIRTDGADEKERSRDEG